MNRTLLWCTLLFVIFVIAFPATKLALDPDPLPVAAGKLFRLGIDLQGGTRLVYGVNYAGTNAEPDDVQRILTDRIDPTGTKDYVVQPTMQGQRIEIIMAGANKQEVQTVKSLVTRSGYLTFRIVVDGRELKSETIDRIADDRLRGVAPPAEYKWVPVKWNSKVNWPRIRDLLFPPDSTVTREQAMQGNVTPGGTIYVIHETAGSGYLQVGTEVVDVEDEAGSSDAAADMAAGDQPGDDLAEGGDTADVEAASPPAEAEAEADEAERREVSDVFVLVRDDLPIVDGDDFASTRKDQDTQTGSPIIVFSMATSADAQGRLYEITSDNVGKRMGIVLDGKLQSAPNIQDALREGGRITGYETTEERDAVLAVLQSGTLDVELTLLSEGTVGPELGADNIRRGLWASLISLVCVVVFMGVYYLLAGVIADVAMVLNLLIVILFMHWMEGTWTLPGIAGLVLTVGMSVDANVLIFERIREELERGSSIRLAIRNGYSRAMPAIFDGNLTTFLTAAVLFSVGSPEIRGFAVVLMFGLLSSMFTALLFTRAVFELLLGAGLLRGLPMLRLFKAPNVQFSRIARPLFTVTAILAIGGIVLSFASGEGKFAMEFRGGTQVEANFSEPIAIEDVRKQVARLDDGDLVTFRLEEAVDVETVREQVVELGQGYDSAIVTPDGDADSQGLWRRFNVQVFDVSGEQAAQAIAGNLAVEGQPTVRRVVDLGFGYANAVVQPLEFEGARSQDRRYIVQVLSTDDDMVRRSLRDIFGDKMKDAGELQAHVESQVLTAADVLEMQGTVIDQGTDTTAAAEEDEGVEAVATMPILPDYQKYLGAYRARVDLTGGGSARPSQIASRIDRYLDNQEREKAAISREIEPLEKAADDAKAYTSFSVYVYDSRIRQETTDQDKLVRLQRSWDAALRRAISDPPALSSSKVDERIGDESWHKALIAIIVSLGIIIVYIWFRFARISYGLAAVAALVHDVCIALGCVILFSWVGKNIPFIGEMKIDLAMIGAFLTLIGYSLNDSIVVFDRIRENRGKFGELSENVVNGSLNQTLTRTVLTSLTTWLVVIILYFFGGVQSSIHGFAFVLAIGVIVGTYSSIFIASPLLLWLRKTAIGRAGGPGAPGSSSK